MSSPIEAFLRPDDLIDDSAVATVEGDEFEHDAIAGRIVEVLGAGQTPLNVALYGPWGSGKSSIYRLMSERLKADDTVKLVRYDAWKYGGDSLKRNFISSAARSLSLESNKKFMQGLYETRREVRLDWIAFLLRHWRSLVLIFLFSVAVATGWAAVISLASIAKDQFFDDFWNNLPKSLLTLGTVVLTLMTSLKIVDGANLTVESSAPSSDEQFAETFRELIKEAKKKFGAQRLVFFVDELDRCAPNDVVSTLISLKTFLDEPDAAFVVAADRLVLEAALDDGLRQVTPTRAAEPYYSTSGAFLEKIFQYQFSLPPLRERALTGFARDLVANKGGLWNQIREHGSNDLLEAVVYVLIPAHVRSPRRVKALLNGFATSCRVAEARGIDWLKRVLEIAQLSTLEIEFPDVARSLLQHPSLLQALRNEDTASEDAKRAAHAFETGAGPSDLILDVHDKESLSAKAAAVSSLHRQLVRYLERVTVTDVIDPSPDLFYLQQPGGSQRFDNDAVARAVDMAEEESVTTTLASFASASSSDRLLGIEVLLGMAENAVGPGRGNVLEAASRLSEGVPDEELRSPARRFVAPLISAEKKRDLRHAASPGAVRILAAAESESLINLVAGHSTDTGTLLAACRWGAVMSSHDIEALAGFVQDAMYEGNEALLDDIVREADERILEPVLNACMPAVLERMEESGTEVAATRILAARMDFTAAEMRLTRLVEASADRELMPAVMLKVMTFALATSDVALRSIVLGVVREHIESAHEGVTRSAIALAAAKQADSVDLPFWVAHITSGDTSGLYEVLVRLLDALRLDEAGERTSALSGAIEIIASLLTGTEEINELLEGAQALLGQENWARAGGVGRVDDVYGAVRALEPVLGAGRVDKLLSDDLWQEAHAGSFSASGLEVLQRQLDASSLGAARHLADAFELQPLSESSLVARLEFAAVMRAGRRTARTYEDVSNFAESAAAELVADWLGARPAVNDVLALMRRGRVSLRPMRVYASHASDPEAGLLWVEAESLGWSTDHLRAYARSSVGDVATAHLRDRILFAPRVDDRAAAVRRLLTVPFGAPGPGVEPMVGIAMELLKTGMQSNAVLAAQLVVVVSEIPRGYKLALRDRFDEVHTKQPKALTATQSEKLVRLGVLSRRKKGLFRKK
ncbi:hypothetical protein JOE38_001955 [Clavibacter michiganensis]|uniref:KAP family P-loop NTPase fold protein n=1 Tax=Clavibacter michiganensis TaxID=28447 RepID=UPI00195C06A4|nr:P-loop NTPase fold protein [Clavibacter michiganensis]MBM7412132.1 hypothetical protein [Clavibacter michiganensis]